MEAIYEYDTKQWGNSVTWPAIKSGLAAGD